MILCLALLLSLTITASATDVTINTGGTGKSFTAYRLLDATQNADGTSYGYQVNENFKSILCEQLGITDSVLSEEELSKQIRGAIASMQTNSDALYQFANDVYNKICIAESVITEGVHSTTDGRFIDLPQGYYLIVETGELTDGDTRSLHMLNTVGQSDIEITTKESAPQVQKKVLAQNDSEELSGEAERDYADYDIGDEIPFVVSAKASGRYEHYQEYTVTFEDTMSEGLNMLTDDNGQIKDMTISIGGIDVTKHFVIELKDNKQGFTAKANLKKLEEDHNKEDGVEKLKINHLTNIVISYKGVLTDKAQFGKEGNTNTVVLKYQNDPYAESEPTNPGETPPDTVVVFTFKGVLNKVMEDKTTPLKGAEFLLQKFDKTKSDWVEVKRLGGDETTKFEFAGLDVGVYRLSEPTPPDGYSPIVPFEFEIDATYDTTLDNEGKTVELTELKIVDRDGDELGAALGLEVTIDNNLGIFSSNIVNAQGKPLPTTGGTGTTLIYIAGGILVLAAIVLLVTKKRMSSAD